MKSDQEQEKSSIHKVKRDASTTNSSAVTPYVNHNAYNVQFAESTQHCALAA